MYPRGGVVPAGDVDEYLILPRQAVGMLGYARVIAEPGKKSRNKLCTVPQNFKLAQSVRFSFDLVNACEGVFLLCFLGQIVT